VGTATAPSSAREALDMVRAGLSYLAAADAAQLSAATQAESLREMEQAGAVLTAARAFVLAGFTAGQGYGDDAEYSAVSWLMHRTGITRGAAVGHAAWARRTGTYPKVLAALAAGQVAESAGRLICLWTAKLPERFRDESDEVLIAAAAAGLGLEERLAFHVLGAIDEFQRELIIDGTREGLDAARARWRTGGRKPKLNDRQAATVRRMYEATGPDGKRQHTVAEIAEAVSVHRTTVYDYLNKEG